MRLGDLDKLGKKIFSFEGGFFTPTNVQKVIDQAPTVDAVEVVRCKECKHRFQFDKTDYLYDGGWYCPETGWNVTDTDFCSRGERK